MKWVSPIRDINKVYAIGDYLSDIDQAAYIVWLLCTHSGYRVQDVLNLQVYQLRAKGDKIREHIKIREIKTGKARDYSPQKEIRPILREYMKGRRDKEYLIPSPRKHGKPCSRQWMWNKVKEAAAACGVEEDIGTHSMRKTFAYHYYIKYKDIEENCLDELRGILNHDDVRTTRTYIGVEQAEIDRKTSRLVFVERP